MHLVDITMFYAAEGGGVSTYLNAKARWLAQRSRVRHTIASPNVCSSVCSSAQAPSTLRLPSLRVPGLHGYRWPYSVGTAARLIESQPFQVAAGQPHLVQ